MTPGQKGAGRRDMKRAEVITSFALLVLVVLGGVGAWRAVVHAAESDARVDHTHHVIEATKDVFQGLTDAETGQRGYLITGQDAYLQPFMVAGPYVANLIATLRDLTIDNPTQQAHLKQLRGLADDKLGELRRTIELRRSQGFGAALTVVESSSGKQAMDRIRALIATMQAEEQHLLQLRAAVAASADQWVLRGGAITAFLALFALGYGLTLLRRAERRLEQSSARLRATLENVTLGVLLVDAGCRVVEWNARLIDVLGLSLSITRGITTTTDLEANLPEDLDSALHPFTMPPLQQNAFTLGNRCLEVSGTTLAVGGAIWTVQDVTERRTTERVAIQSQRLEAVGLMIGGIAHNFNNLLTAVLGNLELMSKKVEDRPQVARMLQRAALAAQRGSLLVGQLLSFGRQQIVSPKSVDLHELIEQMADVIRTTLGNGADLRLELGEVRERVLIDPGQLELALLNLVLNARDAMRSNPLATLTIALSETDLAGPNAKLGSIPPGRYVQVRITDTGVGMTEDVLGRAFEPFFTTKDVGEGSGLGLSQAYGLVKQFKGAIALESSFGDGTTVTLYLPVAPPKAVLEGKAARNLISGRDRVGRSRHGRILLVEDDQLVRDFTAEILRDLGYEVLEAGDADAGWEILATADRIDLLCTDIMMPGSMNGFQLAEKARGKRPDLKLVYMSGYPDKAFETGKPANGSVPFIAKPFTGGELAAGVARAMGR
jgi:signal transduction histidine kinase